MHQWRGHSLINKSKKNSANKDENAAPTKSLNHARSDTNHNNGKMDNVNKDETKNNCCYYYVWNSLVNQDKLLLRNWEKGFTRFVWIGLYAIGK